MKYECGDGIDKILQKKVSLVLAAFEVDQNDDAIQKLAFNTMKTNFRGSKGPCKAYWRPYDTDICHAKGFLFLPEWPQRNAKQENSVHGDTSKIQSRITLHLQESHVFTVLKRRIWKSFSKMFLITLSFLT